MNRIRAFIAMITVAVLALVVSINTTAQEESPAASPATVISAVLIGGGQPAAAPGHDLTLRRITLPPGTGIAAHTQPGALIIYVESGDWGYTPLSGTVRLTRAAIAGASPSLAEDLAMGTEVLLVAGDVLYVEEPGDAIRNAGDEDVVLLIAGLTRVDEPFTTLIGDLTTPSGSPTAGVHGAAADGPDDPDDGGFPGGGGTGYGSTCTLEYRRADTMWAPAGQPAGSLGVETITLQLGGTKLFETDWAYEKLRNDGVTYFGSHLRRARAVGTRQVDIRIRGSVNPQDTFWTRLQLSRGWETFRHDLVAVTCPR